MWTTGYPQTEVADSKFGWGDHPVNHTQHLLSCPCRGGLKRSIPQPMNMR